MPSPGNTLDKYLTVTYGGKKALARLTWNALRVCIGAFERYQAVDWNRVSRVVFVCKGNICRSAFAEKRFRRLGMKAASAGLDADPGKPADAMATRVARRMGTDLSAHRSTHIAQFQLQEGDLLVAFEPEHADQLRQRSPDSPGVQITLLGLWSPSPPMAYLHDPYGSPEAYFETCFKRIEGGLRGLQTRCFHARARKADMT